MSIAPPPAAGAAAACASAARREARWEQKRRLEHGVRRSCGIELLLGCRLVKLPAMIAYRARFRQWGRPTRLKIARTIVAGPRRLQSQSGACKSCRIRRRKASANERRDSLARDRSVAGRDRRAASRRWRPARSRPTPALGDADAYHWDAARRRAGAGAEGGAGAVRAAQGHRQRPRHPARQHAAVRARARRQQRAALGRARHGQESLVKAVHAHVDALGEPGSSG